MVMRHKFIEAWDDERPIGNSLIVSLKPGRAFVPNAAAQFAEHVRGFDSVRDAMKHVLAAKTCRCEDCARQAAGD